MKYSVVIRSLGNTDYLNPVIQSLLDQSVPSDDIVIVVPYNTKFKNFRFTDKCRIIESRKGMVEQRNVGMKAAKHGHALILDDDLLFPTKSSAEKLLNALESHSSACVLPYYPEDNTEGLLYKLFEMFFLIAIPTRKNKLSYLRSGGYLYPSNPPVDEPHLTEGGRGACAAVNLKWLKEKNIYLSEEFERVTYALRDDGAFVYEIALEGGKPIIIDGIETQHIGITHRATSERLYNLCVSTIYNNYIFWKKYIYARRNLKFLSILAFLHYMVGQIIICILKAIKHKKLRSLSGIKDGIKLVLTTL